MDELTVEINTKNLETAMRIFPERLKFELGDGFDHIGRRFLNNFRKARLQGPPGIKGRPHGIFGHFYRASLVSKNIEGMGTVIFSDSKIARLQEEGGIVKNPGGGKLAVPLSARTEMFTSSGKLKQQYRKPRMIKNVIPIDIRGKTYLAKIKKKARGLLPLFVLKNQIRIKPRLGFYQVWDSMQNDRIDILNKSIEKAIKETY
jgi:hypothetical protein